MNSTILQWNIWLNLNAKYWISPRVINNIDKFIHLICGISLVHFNEILVEAVINEAADVNKKKIHIIATWCVMWPSCPHTCYYAWLNTLLIIINIVVVVAVIFENTDENEHAPQRITVSQKLLGSKKWRSIECWIYTSM